MQKKPRFFVRNNGEHIELRIYADNNTAISAFLEPSDVTVLVARLLKACVQNYVDTKNTSALEFLEPVRSLEDIKAPTLWPIQVALSESLAKDPATGERNLRMANFIAAFGEAQIALGIQRERLKPLAEFLLMADQILPATDKYIFDFE